MRAFFSPLMEEALRLAACAHRDQCRKGTSLPYLTHPAAVALILCRAGFHEDHLLAAALLHDVVEDTPWTLNQLAERFPHSVVDIVQTLSEDKTAADGTKRPWRIRKQEHIDHVRTGSLGVKAVVLADKLHNLGSMWMDYQKHKEQLWERFNASPDDIDWYHRQIIDAADADDDRLRALQEACREMLGRLLSLRAGL